jgi:phosphopentomutase
MDRRVILIVLDSFGIGASPDASLYGDEGADTFGHILKSMDGKLNLPTLLSLGLANIDGISEEAQKYREDMPEGAFGKLREKSAGKDTTTGHWEMCGLITQTPFKTYPEGFPEEFIKLFEKKIGRKVLGNYPASGTVIIEELGPEHEKSGRPIVYTSADSVFQIAACTDVIPLDELYRICKIARELLVGEWACGRVIARPYIKRDGKRIRTGDRKDFSLSPFGETLLDKIKEAGKEVYAIGKISDIFNGRGITGGIHTKTNAEGMEESLKAMASVGSGLIFTNLVDFDSKFGHRRDPEGYGRALMEFDQKLPELLGARRKDDILIICADHGNDPTHAGTDHTREYVPCLISGDRVKEGVNLGIRQSFADMGQTIAEYLKVGQLDAGSSFLNDILK